MPSVKVIFSSEVRAKSRSLLRALLRESSYLPDPVARIYTRSYILTRFRAYHPRAGNSSSKKDKPAPITLQRLVQLRKTGWRTVRQMQKASGGDTASLTRVLLHAYGRTGRRKHELLEPLKKEDPGPASECKPIAQLAKRPNLPKAVFDTLRLPSPSLIALANSQASTNPSELLSAHLKRGAQYDIPEKNIWQRPLPVKRVVNSVRKRYGEILDKILPPLPLGEWNRLRDLAIGTRKWDGPVPRRKRCGPPSTPEPDAILGGIPHDIAALRGGREKPHRLTARYMQRVYQEVFKACPVMESHEVNAKTVWSVRWGRSELQHRVHANATANARLLALADPAPVDREGRRKAKS